MIDSSDQATRRIVVLASTEWPGVFLAHALASSELTVPAVFFLRELPERIAFRPRQWPHATARLGVRLATHQLLGMPYGLAYEGRRLLNRQRHPHRRDLNELTETQVHEVADLTSAATRERIASVEPDVIVICGTPILPADVLDLARLCTLNIHTSLLPHYRGGGSIHWARFFRDFDKIGYTIHRAVPRVDAGGYLFQEQVAVRPDDTDQDITERCFRQAIPNLIRLLRDDPLDEASFSEYSQPLPFSFRAPTSQFRHRLGIRTVPQQVKTLVRKTLVRITSPVKGVSGRAIVFYGHRALPDRTPPDDWRRLLGHPTVAEWRERLRALKRWFRFISMTELTEHLDHHRPLSDNVAVLTIDDGYADFAEQLLPLLEELNIPAALFASTQPCFGGTIYHQQTYDLIDRLQGDRLAVPWMGTELYFGAPLQRMLTVEYVLNPYLQRLRRQTRQERIAAIYQANDLDPQAPPVDAFCTAAMLRQLAASPLVDVLPHSHSHDPYKSLKDAEIQDDLAICKRHFERDLNLPFDVFSYPNGLYHPGRAPFLNDAGIRYAFTTEQQAIRPDGHWQPLALPRLGLDNSPLDALLWNLRRLLRHSS